MGSDTWAWRRSPRKTSLTWLCRGPPSRLCTTALAIRVRWPMFPRLMPPAALGEGASGRQGPPGSAVPRPLPQASSPWSSSSVTGSAPAPLHSQLREARAAPRAGGGPEDQRRAGAATAARERPGTWGNRGPSGDPAVGSSRGGCPCQHDHTAPNTRLFSTSYPPPRRPTAEDGKTPGFPRSETQPSRPKGMAPLSTVFSLLSSVTAREDTKGPDLVSPPGRRRGPGDWEELAQR